MSPSTIEQGNAFRDHIAMMLGAAGFKVETEIRQGFKKTDIIASRQGFGEVETYIIETKDYTANITMPIATEFVAHYGTLIEEGKADKAWFISKSDISPDARALINSKKTRKAATYSEFLRLILGIEPYLHDLIANFERDKIGDWYVRPRTESDGADLEATVRAWLDEDVAEPIAIVSGYGKGKSTFARHLTAQLAKEALQDPTRRVPVLVPLGTIVDEQSLEGLLGKTFTSSAGTLNYNFELFQKLNEGGFFLIVFDGFDEMKHGMTLPRFESNIVELMRLDRGAAKVMILGRDTAFQTDIEFKSIIMGRQTTAGGNEVQARNRRAFRQIGVREFDLAEARTYVERFFPIAAKETSFAIGEPIDDAWINHRTQELLSGKFDDLLKRPVHAQMLCHVSSEKNLALSGLSKHGLFDRFVHFLIDREVHKTARDSRFTEHVRRKFNASVALWLWAEGGASTVSLASLPSSLCNAASAGIHHDYDEVALRKELIAGCLIEKSAGTVFFGHRSLQEFLVAEALLNDDAIFSDKSESTRLIATLKLMTPEISEFVIDAALATPSHTLLVSDWIGALAGVRRGEISKTHLQTLVDLAIRLRIRLPDIDASPWYVWFNYFVVNGSVDFEPKNIDAADHLSGTMIHSIHNSTRSDHDTLISTIALLCYASHGYNAFFSKILPAIVSNWLDANTVKEYTDKAKKLNRVEHAYVKDTDNLAFWAFLHGVSDHNAVVDGNQVLLFDLNNILLKILPLMSIGFVRNVSSNEDIDTVDAGTPELSLALAHIDPQSVYRYWGQRVKSSDLDKIRPFFNDPAVRRKIRPLEVEIASARGLPSDRTRSDAKPFGPDPKAHRPTIRMPSARGLSRTST
jgi:hypothetical protein